MLLKRQLLGQVALLHGLEEQVEGFGTDEVRGDDLMRWADWDIVGDEVQESGGVGCTSPKGSNRSAKRAGASRPSGADEHPTGGSISLSPSDTRPVDRSPSRPLRDIANQATE
jgi:hypothetical protein